MFFTLMKTQDWAETSVLLDNNICSTILAIGVSLLIIMPVPSHAKFFQMIRENFTRLGKTIHTNSREDRST